MAEGSRSFENYVSRSENFEEFETVGSRQNLFENFSSQLFCPKSGDSVVHRAVRSGCIDILKYFGETCKDSSLFTRTDIHGKTPLHIAAQEGSLDCTKYLLTLGVPVDSYKKGDWTPLMLACARGHLNIVQELIKAGANLHLRNKDGWTAFHIASRTGCMDILKCLYDKDQSLCCTKSENCRTPLHTAALHGHLDIVDFLVNSVELKTDERDACGNSPLMDAVRSNNTEILQLLLQKNKVNGEMLDLLGRNVLHISAECGSNQCIHYILQHKIIDLNSRSLNGGQTALHYAAKEGHIETVRLLLQSGIDHQIQDSKGRTAADIANLTKHLTCIQEIEYYEQLHCEAQS